ncbi:MULTISPECIES: hypothetical protein [Catellatospora]|uniref:Uncharacterized protein n=1 Tax=Catellatospora coxensis TaxID=310354 RepID=A0A8J3PAW4_9ACTN|nr:MULTISPECIES: hypothetical protein [Catellatospora]GIG08246.1 hypothetical protein Cco03nite_49460 [Catellatospora coxensis]
MDAITELLTSINDLLASLISIVLGGAAPGLPVDPSLPPIPGLPELPVPGLPPLPPVP